MTTISQLDLDRRNAAFWNEACGTHLARRTKTTDNYAAFDREYFKIYPFLTGYLDKMWGNVLEIGTGYGTVAQYLSEHCESYTGLDIAEGPLKILKARGLDNEMGSALSLPFGDDTFDGVVSIGCLHHTGNTQRAISELWRVLRPGGRALVMLYNAEAKRKAADRNTKGENAPHTDFVTITDVLALFALWSTRAVSTQNGEYMDIYIEAVK